MRALKSAQSMGQEATLKLSKKRVGTTDKQPVLTFDIQRLEGGGGQGVGVVHDVPLQMMNEQDMIEYKEPDLANPEVQIYLPPLKIFRGVVDRLKNVVDQVTLHATSRGTLSLTADTPSLESSIEFRNLSMLSSEEVDGNPDGETELKIDLKKLSRVLTAERAQVHSDIIASFHDSALVLHFLGEAAYISSYIPLCVLDPDME